MREPRFLIFLLGASLFWLAASQIYDPANPRGDFSHDYLAGLLVRSGHPGDMYAAQGDYLMPDWAPDTLRAHGYPGEYVSRFFTHPFYALLMVPFTYLPYRLAASVFLVLQIGLWALWLWALFREKGPLWFLGGLAVLLLFYPARSSLAVGQVTGFFIPLAGYFALRPDKTLSQLGLALMFLVKPVAILLPLWFVLQRKWRGLLVFAGAWVLASLLAVALLGPEPLLHHIALVAERGQRVFVYADVQSSLAVIQRFVAGTAEAWEREGAIVAMGPGVKIAYYAWVVAVIGASGWFLRRVKDPFARANLLILASLLILPYAAGDYLALAFVPLVGLLRTRARPLGFLLAAGGFLLMNLPRAHYAQGLVFRFLCWNMFPGVLLIFGAYLSLGFTGSRP